jgi:hypothetical protein
MPAELVGEHPQEKQRVEVARLERQDFAVGRLSLDKAARAVVLERGGYFLCRLQR